MPWSVIIIFSKLQGDNTTNLWTKVKSPCQTDANSWQYNQSSLLLLVNNCHVSWNNPMIPPGKQVMYIRIAVTFRGMDAGAVPLAIQPWEFQTAAGGELSQLRLSPWLSFGLSYKSNRESWHMLFMELYGRYIQGLHMKQARRMKDKYCGKTCG